MLRYNGCLTTDRRYIVWIKHYSLLINVHLHWRCICTWLRLERSWVSVRTEKRKQETDKKNWQKINCPRCKQIIEAKKCVKCKLFILFISAAVVSFSNKRKIFDQYSNMSLNCRRLANGHNETVYRVSRGECARLRENVPYVKVHQYNPKHLYPKLNGYGDNGQRKVWFSCGSTYSTCSADALPVHCACPSLRVECSQLIPKCAVSNVKSVLQYCWICMCHVKCLEP